MGFKSKVFAAAAALALSGGIAGVLAASPAGAATPSCGNACIDIFSWQFGGFHHPNFVLDVYRQGAKPGQKIILYKTSNSDPAQDLSAEFSGHVSDFRVAGMVSPAVALRYGCGFNLNTGQCSATGYPDDLAGEIEYAPFGVDSGLCLGLASTAYQNEGVTLQHCGVSAKTVWIVDTGDQARITSAGVPLINGSDTNFSHPFVLTYPAHGYPTNLPRPQLKVANLTGFTGSFLVPVLGTVNSNQLWSATLGVLP